MVECLSCQRAILGSTLGNISHCYCVVPFFERQEHIYCLYDYNKKKRKLPACYAEGLGCILGGQWRVFCWMRLRACITPSTKRSVRSNVRVHVRRLLVSIVASIPACHAGDRGSIPRRGVIFLFLGDETTSATLIVCQGQNLGRDRFGKVRQHVRDPMQVRIEKRPRGPARDTKLSVLTAFGTALYKFCTWEKLLPLAKSFDVENPSSHRDSIVDGWIQSPASSHYTTEPQVGCSD